MIYTKSSELPKEDGKHWLKYRYLEPEEGAPYIEEDIVNIWTDEHTFWDSEKQESYKQIDRYVDFLCGERTELEDIAKYYELLAWCKIEKPEECGR